MSVALLMVACGPAETQPVTANSSPNSPAPVVPGPTAEPVGMISRVIIGSLLTVAAGSSAQLPLSVLPTSYDATALDWSLGPTNSSPPGLLGGNDIYGTVSSTGVYTAPSVPGTYRIFAIPKGWNGTPNPPAVYDYSEVIVTASTSPSTTPPPTTPPPTTPPPTTPPPTTPPPTTPPPTTPPPTTSGATYFVSLTGSDANPGTESAPWRTIGKAAATLAPGDTAIIEDGRYNEDSINWRRSGTADKRITIRARNKWQAIVDSRSGCAAAFDVQASYITVDGLRFSVASNNPTCGTYLSTNVAIRAWPGNSPSINGTASTAFTSFILRNSKVDMGREIGIKIHPDFSIIENNEISPNIETMTGFGIIVRGNIITDPGHAGNDMIHGKGGVRNLQVYNNVVLGHTGAGRGIFLGGNASPPAHFDDSTRSGCVECNNIEAYNSIAYNNVVVGDGGGDTANFGIVGGKDCALVNNVSIGGSFWFGPGSDSGTPRVTAINPLVQNNIMSCKGSPANIGWSYTGKATVSNNLLFGCSGTLAQSNGVSGDPRLVNVASDWHLLTGSPAIGAGVMLPTFPGYGGTTITLDLAYEGYAVSTLGRTSPWNLGIY
jgi:hypothetical protein